MILWGATTAGPTVPPGRYTVRLTADGRTLTAPVTVARNPHLESVTAADLRAQYVFGRRVRDRATDANRAVIAIRRVRTAVDDRVKQKPDDAALKGAADSLRAHATAVEERIYQVRNRSGQDPLNFPIRVNNRLATLLSMSERGDGPPNQGMREIYDILDAELRTYEAQLARVWATDLAALNRELARLGLAPVSPDAPRAAPAAE